MSALDRRPARFALAALLLTAAQAGQAHDTWLARAAEQPGSGLLRLEMGTAERYPMRDSATPATSVASAACQPIVGREQPLRTRQSHPDHLELRARVDERAGVACWAELSAHEATLTHPLVATYLDESRAPPAVRDAWTRMQERGLAWRETYRKSMRIELPPPWQRDLSPLRTPTGRGLELVPTGPHAWRSGERVEVQALLDGAPVAGLAVEFVSDRHRLGVWQVTDADGRAGVRLPFSGHWLVRSTRIDVPTRDTEPWKTRFATLLVPVP